MRRYTMMQKTCGWATVYNQIEDMYSKTEADRLFDQAQKIYDSYINTYKDVKGIQRVHILGSVCTGALYLSIKDVVGSKKAMDMMTEAVKPFSVSKHNRIEKMPAGLYMKVVTVITSILFGEKAGFHRRWHQNTKMEKSFDLLTCPYVEVLKDMHCVEVCPVICIQDDYSFSDLKNGVIFERKKTLGRQNDCCDFCFKRPYKKN